MIVVPLDKSAFIYETAVLKQELENSSYDQRIYEAVLKKKKEGGKLSETEKQQEKENYIEEAYNNLVNIMK